MRDFPIFTTDRGVSSLILKEIPYRQSAFICIRDVQPGFLQEHLAECIQFCRMAGAEQIYASGHEDLESFPLYTRVLRMQGIARSDPERQACLFPVTEETAGKWRCIYNEAMKSVDNASTLEARDEKKLLSGSGAYFIHDGGELLGIGWLEDNALLALAAVQKGAGERTLLTLMSLIEGEMLHLEVASTNQRAIGLYQRMGLIITGEVSAWYRVN